MICLHLVSIPECLGFANTTNEDRVDGRMRLHVKVPRLFRTLRCDLNDRSGIYYAS